MKPHQIQYSPGKKVVLITACLVAALNTGAAMAQTGNGATAEAENIALGKTVTFSTPPNYVPSTDPDDNKQITDGLYSSQGELRSIENTTAIWVQKGTVGWFGFNPTITIDLGKVQPISGVSYSTAAGASDVRWPEGIYLAVSDDNKNWHYVGDLTLLADKKPPAEGLAAFRFSTRALKTKGRYLQLTANGRPYVFVDEIEVYRGQDSWVNEPTSGDAALDSKTLIQQATVLSRFTTRLNHDWKDISEALEKAWLPASKKSALRAKLKALDLEVKEAVKGLKNTPADMKTILPLNQTHARILAVNGELLAAEDHRPLTVWKAHRYGWLPLLTAPPKASAPAALNFSMLKNQFRSDAFLLTNAGSIAKTVSLKLSEPPRGAQANWLQVSSVAWTDSVDGFPVADALLPVAARSGVYEIDVPAGMTRKVWLTVDSSKLTPGETDSTLEVRSGGTASSVPLKLSIKKLAMPVPRLSMGAWDYTNGQGTGAITPRNREAAIKLMRSYYVDTPWATKFVLPWPSAEDFDAQGNLIKELDFSEFDHWVSMWSGARNYFVYAAVGESFAGALMGTPEFGARIGSWAKALSFHMKSLTLQPKQLGLLLVDEPHTEAMDMATTAWAKAINASAPELTLFSDPIWERPDQAANHEARTEMDILSPLLPVYRGGGEPVAAYFEDLRKNGKTLWLYQCDGPIRSFSPQRYYRANAWHAFSMGAIGQNFWAFGDTGTAPTSWQSYLATTVAFEPAFIDVDKVNSSVHWESIREGVEDYEELAMLRDAIAKTKNGALKAQAQNVLNGALAAVTGQWKNGYVWKEEKDGDLTDRQLAGVRAMLIRLNP